MTVLLKNTAVKISTSAFCSVGLKNIDMLFLFTLNLKNPKQPKFSRRQKCLMKGTVCRMKIGLVILTGNSSDLFHSTHRRQWKGGRRTQILNELRERRLDSHLSPSLQSKCFASSSLGFLKACWQLLCNYNVYENKFCCSFQTSKQRLGLHVLLVLQTVAGMISHLWSCPAAFPQHPCHRWVTWSHQSLGVLQSAQVLGAAPLCQSPHLTETEALCLCHSQGKGCTELAVGDTDTASPDTKSNKTFCLPPRCNTLQNC